MRRLLHILTLSAVAFLSGTATARDVNLVCNFLPGEEKEKGEVNTERRLLWGYSDGHRSYEWATVTDDSPFVYSLPPAGTKIDYWLTGEGEAGQYSIWYDQESARTSYGTNTLKVADCSSTSTLYVGARFAYISYGIAFDGNGNTSGTMSSLSGIVYTNSFALTANEFAKTGYSFAGWKAPDGKVFSDAQTVKGSDFGVVDDGTNVLLAARWTAKTSALTFSANGGTGTMPTGKVATYGAAMPTYGQSAPTRTGYTFGGFVDGSGTLYYTAALSSARNWDKDTTSGRTLYARWTLNQYSLTLRLGEHVTRIYYKINGASNWTAITTDTTLSVNYGSTWYGYAETQAGYTAYRRSDNPYEETMGAAAKEVAFTAYANSYTVTLNQQSGSGGTASVTATYGSAMPSATMPTRTGYTFCGYWTGTNGTGTQYYTASGTSAKAWDKTEATTLYAFWADESCTLTIASSTGSGSGSVSPSIGTYSYKYGTPISLFALPDASSYFVRWSDGETLASRTLNIVSNMTVAAEFALYPPVTIQFVANGGTGSMAATNMLCATSTALPSNAFERTGYTFSCWTNSAAPGTTYADGEAVIFSSERSGQTVRFFAVWTANSYTVAFKPGSGSGEMADQDFVYDVPQDLSACTFDPPGSVDLWSFAGWSNCTANAFYEPGETVSNLTAAADGVVELVAVWADARSDLSKAMHCQNLNWTNIIAGTSLLSEWTPFYGSEVGYNSDSCVTNVYSSARLAANVETNGTLSFFAKCANPSSKSATFTFGQDEDQKNIRETTNLVIAVDGEWHPFTIRVEKRSDAAQWWLVLQNLVPGNTRSVVYIDRMTWTPDGSSVEPGEEDARDISGISFDGGDLSLVFTNADERFNYNLRGTNDLAAALSLWPVLWTTNGTGTITITPVVKPDEPKFFYYLETTAK